MARSAAGRRLGIRCGLAAQGRAADMAAGDSLTVGDLLRHYREAAGLTQDALAERARLSARAISDLERGVKHTPRHDTVALLAEALRLSTQERMTFTATARRLSDSSPDRSRVGTRSQPGSTLPILPPFVGRTRELALLARHLAGEGPPVLLLAGEPGIGKSRLLGEAAQRAPGQGWQVLEGGCQRRGGQEPYAPLLGALKRHIESQAPVHLRADLRGCAWLVRLLPELAEGPIAPLPAWTLPPEQERRLMFEAVARFLANVAGSAGTLLVLDDLQWAAGDALDLLATLMRSSAEVPVRVVGAYRDVEVQPADALSLLLTDLAHAGLTTHCTLAPLTPEDAARLLDALLEGVEDVTDDRSRLREQVVQRAGGVPFFLVSCAQALCGSKSEGDGQTAVPWDVAQGIRQRVAALPAVAREVLGAAAVVGRVASRGLLVRVVAQPEEEVLTALDAACRVRLLQENGSDRYQFVHDVIREVAEADLGAGRRTVLHRRIGEALEAEPGASLERLAYHYARSDDYEKAVLYLAQAGDRAAAQYAHAAAESYYREVADRLDTAGRANDAAHVRQKLGAVLSTIGRYDAALAVLERAADTYHTVGDLERLGQTMAQIGRAHADRGTPDMGIAAVQPLLERLAGTSAHARAALYTALAHLYFVSGRCEEQLRVAARAAELLRAVGDRAKLAAAMSERGQALFFTGRPAEALHAHNEALALAEETGDLATLCHALYNGAFIYWDIGEFRVALQRTERALAVAEQLGDPALIVLMALARGEVWRLWGEWAQARADFERALAAGRQLPGTWHIAYALLSSAELSLWQGEWETAARCLEECRGVAERSGHVTVLAWSEPRLAELDLQEGRPEAARDRLRPLLGLAATHDLARAYLELGDVAEASEVAAQCTARAGPEQRH